MREIERHRTTLVFCNTRSLAELIFQDLWDGQRATICRSASTTARCRSRRGARSRRRWRGAAARRWSAPPASISASTGATSTSSSRWARPRARRGCCSGSAAPTTGSTSRAEAILVPGNRFEYLEARAALDAVDEGELDAEIFRPGALDVLAQHVMACACAGAVRRGRACWPRCAAPRLMPGSTEELFGAGARLHRERRLCAARLRQVQAAHPRRRTAPGASRHPALHPAAPDERRDHRRCADARRPLPQRPQARQGRGAVSPRRSRPATPSASPGWCSRSRGSTAST